MKLLKVTFQKCIQDAARFGSDSQAMVSKVFFRIEADGHRHENLSVEIRQKPGSTFSEGVLQIGTVQGYQGPLNDWAFRQAVEQYYRGLARYEEPRVKISFGKHARKPDLVVMRESSVDLEIYD